MREAMIWSEYLQKTAYPSAKLGVEWQRSFFFIVSIGVVSSIDRLTLSSSGGSAVTPAGGSQLTASQNSLMMGWTRRSWRCD